MFRRMRLPDAETTKELRQNRTGLPTRSCSGGEIGNLSSDAPILACEISKSTLEAGASLFSQPKTLRRVIWLGEVV
jgi:hypothetical protein